MFCPFFICKFVLLLILLLFCTLCVPKCSAQNTKTDENVKVFEFEKNINLLKPSESQGETTKTNKLKNLTAPFLLSVSSGIVAIAHVEYNVNQVTNVEEGLKIDLVTKYLKINKGSGDWGNEVMKKTEGEWKTQLSEKYGDFKKLPISTGAVVLAKDNIYIFAVNNTQSSSNSLPYEVTVIEGTVKDSDITWEELIKITELSRTDFDKQFKDVTLENFLSDGSAFLTAKGNLVFVVKGKKNEDSKNVAAFFELEEGEGKKELKFLHVEVVGVCYPYFFLWEKKIMMIPTLCAGERSYKIKESTDMKYWRESKEPLSRLWDEFQNKNYFVTVNINEKKTVLLFTQEKCVTDKEDVCLFISDGTRLAKVGIVATKDEDIFYESLLYTDGELFALYKIKKNSDGGGGTQNENTIVLKRLKSVMENITSVLDTWEKSDALVTALCNKNDVSPLKYTCNTEFPTNGLVSFLSGVADSNNDIWEDSYYYVNATIIQGKGIKDSVTFDGYGSGAKWIVSKESSYYLYNFAAYGFTLFATVTIDNVPQKESSNSVLGVCFNKQSDLDKCFGLWCTNENYWGVSGFEKSDFVKTEKNCNKKNVYFVGITLNDKNIIVFIDNKQLIVLPRENTNGYGYDLLTYVYFGANVASKELNKFETQVTVSNVLLYNWPFTEYDVKKLNIKPVQPLLTHSDGKERGEGDSQSSQSHGGSSEQLDLSAENTKGDGSLHFGNNVISVGNIVILLLGVCVGFCALFV